MAASFTEKQIRRLQLNILLDGPMQCGKGFGLIPQAPETMSGYASLWFSFSMQAGLSAWHHPPAWSLKYDGNSHPRRSDKGRAPDRLTTIFTTDCFPYVLIQEAIKCRHHDSLFWRGNTRGNYSREQYLKRQGNLQVAIELFVRFARRFKRQFKKVVSFEHTCVAWNIAFAIMYAASYSPPGLHMNSKLFAPSNGDSTTVVFTALLTRKNILL